MSRQSKMRNKRRRKSVTVARTKKLHTKRQVYPKTEMIGGGNWRWAPGYRPA